ncbi:MAG: peptidoglycan editing factor PgeF [Oscillospiraceae bacterium]|nr:peptidoglycan editing factor PgeF [Oscillospiraceae bacterium]
MGFSEHRCGELLFHTSSVLKDKTIAHGFSTRLGGVSIGDFASLNLRGSGVTPDHPEQVEENYRRFCNALGVDVSKVVLAGQVHQDTVRHVTAADAGKGLFVQRDYTADALVTNESELNLMVFSADCGIFLLHDPVSRCVGAVHAGWRGTALGLPSKAVAEMGRLFGAKPENIRVAVGAGIGPCCFETDDDVPQAMREAFGAAVEQFIKPMGQKWSVDLLQINLWRLRETGILTKHLDGMNVCTACHPELYWSHRKTGDRRGVQGALIGLKGDSGR